MKIVDYDFDARVRNINRINNRAFNRIPIKRKRERESESVTTS